MKNYEAISMRCTQEQFEAIKPKLEKAGFEASVYSFIANTYLTNCFRGKKNYIANIVPDWASDFNRTVYHQWNEKIFLKACGIETVPSLEEVKEYFKDAKTCKCAYSGDLFDYTELTDVYEGKSFKGNFYGDKGECGSFQVSLFNDNNGYAKILTYKEPKFEITKEDDELWLPVHNYYGFYEVSNMGNVRSLSRKVKHSKNPEFTRDVFGRVLYKSINPQGYNKVQLSMFGINKTHLVYHLVSEVFLGHIDRSDFVCVDHIDEDKTNDKASNLQIITKQQNTKKSFDYKLDRFNKGEYWFHNNGKLVLIDEVTKTHGGTLKCKYIDSDENFAFHGMSVIDRKATPEEVTEALKNEALNRYKKGDYVKFLGTNSIFQLSGLNVLTDKGIVYHDGFGKCYMNCNVSRNVLVFNNGIWAEIIPTKTIKEAEQLLKELGHEFKIV